MSSSERRHDPPPLPKVQAHLARPQAQAFLKHHSQKARQEEGQGEMTYHHALVDHYAGVRARLGVPLSSRMPPVPPAVMPAPDIEAPPVAEPEMRIQPSKAPLDMLKPCSWKFLLSLASLRHEVSAEDILGSSRKIPIAAARHEAMALAYQHTQASLPALGANFGKHHSTVLHAIQKRGCHRKLVEPTPFATAVSRPKRPADRAARTALMKRAGQVFHG